MVGVINSASMVGFLPARPRRRAFGHSYQHDVVVLVCRGRIALSAPSALALPVVIFDFLLSLTIWVGGRARCSGRRVVNPHEGQAIRRSNRAARPAVPRFQSGLEVIAAPTAFADQLQRSDNRAHLVVQEGSRRGFR
jgi:hypothetical protein